MSAPAIVAEAKKFQQAQILSSRAEMGMDEQSLIPVTDSQADAIKASAEFGRTAVEEVGRLARYIGRVLGTVPHDVVGIVIGEPLHFVRTKIAQKLDERVTKIHRDRNVQEAQPVSPSVAIPLLRAEPPGTSRRMGKANRGGHGPESIRRNAVIFH